MRWCYSVRVGCDRFLLKIQKIWKDDKISPHQDDIHFLHLVHSTLTYVLLLTSWYHPEICRHFWEIWYVVHAGTAKSCTVWHISIYFHSFYAIMWRFSGLTWLLTLSSQLFFSFSQSFSWIFIINSILKICTR